MKPNKLIKPNKLQFDEIIVMQGETITIAWPCGLTLKRQQSLGNARFDRPMIWRTYDFDDAVFVARGARMLPNVR